MARLAIVVDAAARPARSYRSALVGSTRVYLEDGKRIEIDGMKSYFGPIRLSVRSEPARRGIVAPFECRSAAPGSSSCDCPTLRGLNPVALQGGRYILEVDAR